MLGADVLVVAPMRLFASLDQRVANPVGEIVAGQKILLVVAKRFLFRGDLASAGVLLVVLWTWGRAKAT